MKKSKVYYFKPVMNFIFSHPKSLIALIFYIIIEIVGVFFPIKEDITHYLDIIQLPANQFLVQFVLVLISVTLSGLFSHILRIKKYFLHQFIFFKQSLYNKLNYLYKTQDISKLKKITIQWIIVIFYHHEKIMFNSQEETIRSILQKMNARSSNKIFWIQGDAYSGKTTTILNLLIYLITFRDFSVLYEKLDGQILYFDLGNDDFQIKNLIDEHNQGKYENKLLLLDNFHKISEINCKDILSNILINLRAFAVIIAMRKPESFLAGPKYLKDLKTAISERGLLYKLDGIEKEFNTSSSDEFKVFLEEFGLSNDEMLNIPLSIHFLSLHSKERSDYKQFIPRIRSFIKGKAQWDAFDDMLLALVSASLFTGSFSLKTVKSLDIYSLTQWNKFLKYLLNLGFVISYPHSQKTYYFLHEKIAKFYLKKTFNIPLYKKKYLDYFNKLYLYYKNLENARFTFLYALLQNNSEIEETVFNKIITNINFLNFYEEINFLLQLDETKRKKFYRELGILCDRSGKLNESLNYYKEYLNVAQNDQCIDALYKIIQINHEYQSKYPAIEQNAATHKKPYYKLLHDYWQEHIKMHNGIFEFETYKKIVIQADKESDVIFKQHPYDGLHLLRRIYFDLFRVYYLAGVLDPNTILTFLSDKNHLKALLNQNLDEFEAYYIKFAIAQFLAHDLLFTLSFTAGTVDEKIYSDIFFQHINLPHDVLDNQEIVAKKAIELFEYAIKLMNQLADKTALFIEYHMYGVKLSLENENFGTCEEFYKKYIKFAEDEKDVEYQSYAELYKLKMILVKMNSLSVIEDLTAIARLAKEAKKQIDKTKELQKKCNMVNGNPYADLRLELYDALLDLRMQSQFNLSRKSIKQKFLIIKNKAEAMKYRREVLLIQYLEKTNFLISTVNWKNIVRYYPIVTQ